MTVSLVINGNTYFYPETGDTSWGPEATSWASAVTVGMLQKAGGLFTLLSEVDFGASFGVKSLYYKSRTTNPAAAGQVRIARADTVSWRNEANSADLALAVDSSNRLTFNGSLVQQTVTVSDTSTIDMTKTGDDISAAIVALSITDALISASAAIDATKLGNGNVDNTELSYVNGVTSSIQTQLNAKQATGNYITDLTGDVTASGPGSVAATIANAAVSLAKMANLAANSIIGNNTGSPATPIALTGTQVTAMLTAFVGDSGSGGTKGLVPAPASGDAAAVKFLKADGTWATTPAGPSQATATVLGTVKGGTVPGSTTGSAIAAGYLGEIVLASITQTTITTSMADVTGASLPLSAGTWRIHFSGTGYAAAAASINATCQLVARITDNANTLIGTSDRSLYVKSTVAVTTDVLGMLVTEEIVNPSTSTTYKLRAQRFDTGGTGSALIFASADGSNRGNIFYAIRVG